MGRRNLVSEPPATALVRGGNYTSGQTIAANGNRHLAIVQNQGTNALSVTLDTVGSGTVAFYLHAGDANADGKGGMWQDDTYQGKIVVGGTSPRFGAAEFEFGQ